MSMICFLLGVLFLHTAQGHGRLTSPVPRFGTGSNNGAENAPVTFGSDQWVCRHDGPVTPVTREIAPGGTISLTWDFSAAHVGDCALYISYDVSSTRAEQKFFKVANLYDCRSKNNQAQTVEIPSWLPAGQVVVRWDWYALHQHPNVEFYSQCYDAKVTGSNGAQPNLYTYKINNPDIYPSTANVAPGYSNRFNGGTYMTGPPCALGFDKNDCALTTCGTTGYIDPKAKNNAGTFDCTQGPSENNNNNNGDNNNNNGDQQQNNKLADGATCTSSDACNSGVCKVTASGNVCAAAAASGSSDCSEEDDKITSKNKAVVFLSLTLVFVILASGTYMAFKEGWVSLNDFSNSDNKAANHTYQIPVTKTTSSLQKPPPCPNHQSLPVMDVDWHYQNSSGQTVGPVKEMVLVKYARDLGKQADSMYVWNGTTVPEWSFLRDVPELKKQLAGSLRL